MLNNDFIKILSFFTWGDRKSNHMELSQIESSVDFWVKLENRSTPSKVKNPLICSGTKHGPHSWKPCVRLFLWKDTFLSSVNQYDCVHSAKQRSHTLLTTFPEQVGLELTPDRSTSFLKLLHLLSISRNTMDTTIPPANTINTPAMWSNEIRLVVRPAGFLGSGQSLRCVHHFSRSFCTSPLSRSY